MSFIGHIFIKTTFQPLRLIYFDADIVQHINLSEIRSVTNGNIRSFALPWHLPKGLILQGDLHWMIAKLLFKPLQVQARITI